MNKALFLMILLGCGSPAFADDTQSECVLHPATTGSAVVYPVFYAVEFSVQGYSIVRPQKVDGSHTTPTSPKASLPPHSKEVQKVLPIQISPKIFLSRLTKTIDDQLDMPKP